MWPCNELKPITLSKIRIHLRSEFVMSEKLYPKIVVHDWSLC